MGIRFNKVFEDSNKKNLVILGGFLILVSISFVVFLPEDSSDGETAGLRKEAELDGVSIAVCPTYQYLNDDLEESGFNVVSTNSTSESISLLSNEKVEIVISGRKAMPSEGELNCKSIELEGHYSFLAAESIPIYGNNLNSYQIYTDQEVDDIKEIFNLENITKVDDIYDYLDKGVVITSWKNTDYSKASVVHLLNMDGSRNQYSRMPFLYYNRDLNDDIDKIVEIIELNNLKKR